MRLLMAPHGSSLGRIRKARMRRNSLPRTRTRRKTMPRRRPARRTRRMGLRPSRLARRTRAMRLLRHPLALLRLVTLLPTRGLRLRALAARPAQAPLRDLTAPAPLSARRPLALRPLRKTQLPTTPSPLRLPSLTSRSSTRFSPDGTQGLAPASPRPPRVTPAPAGAATTPCATTCAPTARAGAARRRTSLARIAAWPGTRRAATRPTSRNTAATRPR